MNPLPDLKWDKVYWIGDVVLPSWAGTQTRKGGYGAIGSRRPSDGSTRLTVTPSDGKDLTPPTRAQVRAFEFLRDHDAALTAAIPQSVAAAYPKWRRLYGYSKEELAQYMPDIDGPEQLRPLIGLSFAHILGPEKDGIAYIGFEFGCTWDDEHGLGVLTHTDRVIHCGGADVSFDESVARRDARGLSPDEDDE